MTGPEKLMKDVTSPREPDNIIIQRRSGRVKCIFHPRLPTEDKNELIADEPPRILNLIAELCAYYDVKHKVRTESNPEPTEAEFKAIALDHFAAMKPEPPMSGEIPK